MKESRIVALDTETGGTDPDSDALLSIGLAKLSPTLEVEDKLYLKLRIEPNFVVHPQAAKINGYSNQTWHDAVPLQVGLRAVGSWLGSRYYWDPLAHNAQFDCRFLTKAQKVARYDLNLSYHWHCSMSLFAAWRLIARRPGKKNLDALIALSGQPDRGTHDALTDALACAKGYRWLISQLRSADIKEHGGNT